jgi:broad specificity phosphatase PhoE
MILLRHCQSEFNLHYTRTRCDPGIVDPGLTEEGLAQAAAAADALCSGSRIARIVVSPYRRALQTAAPIAARLGLHVTVSSLVRERFAFACDIGSPRATLERDWPGIDFSALDEGWWHDGTLGPDRKPARESEQSVIARAGQFRDEMAQAPDWPETLLVSHWGFLLALTGRSLENGKSLVIDPTVAVPGPIVWQH